MTLQGIGSLNIHLFELVNGLACKNPLLDRIMVLFARYLILILPGYLLYLWFSNSRGIRRRRLSILVLLSSLLSLGIAVGISSAHYYPRPFVMGIGSALLSHAPDSSFPSDHAAVLFAASFSLLLLRSRRSGVGFFLVSSTVGLARVFVGIHFPADILGGLGVGLGASLAIFFLREKLDPIVRWLVCLYEKVAKNLKRASRVRQAGP